MRFFLKVVFERIFRIFHVVIDAGPGLLVICEKNIDGWGILATGRGLRFISHRSMYLIRDVLDKEQAHFQQFCTNYFKRHLTIYSILSIQSKALTTAMYLEANKKDQPLHIGVGLFAKKLFGSCDIVDYKQ